MKWQNHKLCNAAIIYGITGNLRATILSSIGAVLPDILELNGVIRHRTITHYPYIYIVPAILLIPFMHTNIYYMTLFWVIIGCIIHLILDSASKSGIPYIRPYGNDKIAFNLYTTHHISEWYISIFITLIFGMLARLNNFLYVNHFTNELNIIYHTGVRIISANI